MKRRELIESWYYVGGAPGARVCIGPTGAAWLVRGGEVRGPYKNLLDLLSDCDLRRDQLEPDAAAPEGW